MILEIEDTCLDIEHYNALSDVSTLHLSDVCMFVIACISVDTDVCQRIRTQMNGIM